MADIKQLSDREHCRSRCGMYLGSKSDDGSPNPESLRTAIREACDNSKDELLVGHGDTIWIFVDKKAKEPLGLDRYEGKSVKEFKEWYRYTCADNASGIPIKPTKNMKGEEITMTELAVGNFRAGSKFNKDVAIVGLNGIGVSATNFTSAEFSVYSRLSCHDLTKTTKYVKALIKKNKVTNSNAKDWYYKITYNLGIKQEEELVNFKKDGILQTYWGKSKELPSTVTTFIPDPTIHGTTVADVPNDFSYLGYLNEDFNFYIDGKKVSSDIGFDFDDYLKIDINGKPFKKNSKFDADIKNPWIELDYSLGLTKDFKDKPIERYSVNTLDCNEGKHKNIFKACWTKAFCDYFDDWDIEKYAMEGLNVLFIWRCPEPAFSSQTKERCSSVEGWGNKMDQYDLLVKSFTKILKDNEKLFEKQYQRIRELYDAKQNIGKLKELQGMLSSLTKDNNKSSSAFMPRKLLDCSPKSHQKNAEIFFCFTGDTKVLDCNNHKYKFKDLVKHDFVNDPMYTLSCDSNGVLSPSKIVSCKQYKEVQDTVVVTLDNGESFECTPDHKIFMKDGSYKMAGDLLQDDSCMPISFSNVKVISVKVKHYKNPIPVYCLTVDNDLHNFPLAAGIFAKNCEGQSASGGFIKARAGMDNIAVLPLRGKVKNVVGLDTNSCLDNEEIYDITHVCGGVNEVHVPIEKLRYSKYIIASDEDSK